MYKYLILYTDSFDKEFKVGDLIGLDDGYRFTISDYNLDPYEIMGIWKRDDPEYKQIYYVKQILDKDTLNIFYKIVRYETMFATPIGNVPFDFM